MKRYTIHMLIFALCVSFAPLHGGIRALSRIGLCRTAGLFATSWYAAGCYLKEDQPAATKTAPKPIGINFSGNTIEIFPNRTSPAWNIPLEAGKKAADLAKDNPLGLLKYLDECRKESYAAHPELNDESSYDEIEKVTNQISSQPLSLMYECQECGLSRVRNPLARATFDRDVATALAQRAQDGNGKVTYIDIGSGGLFQMATTLANAFGKQKIKELSIHIVDPSYGRFIEDSRDSSGDFPRNDNFYINKYPFDPSVTTEQEKKAALLSTQTEDRGTYNRLQQLAAWCHFLSPQTECRIFVHNQSGDYSKGVRHGELPTADVVTFADPDPNFPYHIAQKFCEILNSSAKRNALNPPVGLGLFGEEYTEKEETHPEAINPGRIVVAQLWKKKQDNPGPQPPNKLVWVPSGYLPLFHMKNFSEGYVARTQAGSRGNYTLEKGVEGYKLSTKLFEDQGLS